MADRIGLQSVSLLDIQQLTIPRNYLTKVVPVLINYQHFCHVSFLQTTMLQIEIKSLWSFLYSGHKPDNTPCLQTMNGVQQRKFLSITELIKAYRHPNNGLVCPLTNPVRPATDKQILSPPPPVAAPMPTRSNDPLRFSQTGESGFSNRLEVWC